MNHKLITTKLPAIKSESTSRCLTSKLWNYRDSDFDIYLPAKQPNTEKCSVSVYRLDMPMTFTEMACVATDVSTETPIDQLGLLLKQRGLTLTLKQLEVLVEKQESGIDVGIRTDSWATFAFIENKDGSVSVGLVSRYVGGWRGDLLPLGRGRRWRVDRRLLLRNSDSIETPQE